jgi:predicted nucleic acid-binding protein
MKAALDTNVLAYVEGVNGPARQDAAVELLQRLPAETAVVPVQVLGELYNVLVRKAGWAASRAREAILEWRDAFLLAPTTETAMLSAIDLAADHQLRIWDSIVISVASDAGCRIVLSEDLQHGFSWRGVTIVNPFSADRHPLLETFLADVGNQSPHLRD